MFRYIVAIVAILAITSAGHLPSYVKPCRRSDANFEKCALEHADEIVPFLVKGDRSLKLRSLDPMNIPEIRMDATGNLKLLLTDITLKGLGQLRPKSMKLDTDKQYLYLDLHGHDINLYGNYKVDGKILILPITGDGKINITLDEPAIGYGFHYDLEKMEDGKEYVKPNKPDVELNYKRAHFDLSNLFNGDPTLGPETNKFLNENWEEMGKELNPSVSETIAVIASDIVDKILTIVPYDEILLP